MVGVYFFPWSQSDPPFPLHRTAKKYYDKKTGPEEMHPERKEDSNKKKKKDESNQKKKDKSRKTKKDKKTK